MSDITSTSEPDRVVTQSSAEVELHDVLTVSPPPGPYVPAAAFKEHTIGDRETVSGNHSVCQAVVYEPEL